MRINNHNHKIIFVHGLGQSSSSWDETASLLSKDIESACISLFSEVAEEEITYKNLYHKFKEYCKQETEPLNLCGISLGAVLSLNYAIDYPAKVRSLILIAPQYKMPRLLLRLQNMLFLILPEAYFKKDGFTKKGLIRLTNSMLDLKFEDKLSSILCKTLIICGEKDTANKRAAISLKRKIPTANLRLVKNAGHEVNVEAPYRLADILNSFYADMDSRH